MGSAPRIDAKARRGAAEVLSTRALNRALLKRQLLLAREDMSAGAAIEHLVGLQAQAPLAPYVGLWSRLQQFGADELARMMLERRALRTPLMRGTIHLVTSEDCLALHALMAQVLVGKYPGSSFARDLAGVATDAVASAGRELRDAHALGRGAATRESPLRHTPARYPPRWATRVRAGTRARSLHGGRPTTAASPLKRREPACPAGSGLSP